VIAASATPRRVLVLSYFFPPCNLPASQRAGGWARYLPEHGFHPVVVTRNWEHPVRRAEDVVRPGGTSIVHREAGGSDVFYLPHRGSLRDRLYCGLAGSGLQWLSKPFTLAERIAQHYVDAATPFRYLYHFARQYLHHHPDVCDLIVTGGPFVLFKFGAQLAAEFPRLRWVADYRDEWTNSQLAARSWTSTLLGRLDRRSERRWLRSAAFVTSVSPFHTRTISAQVERPGHTIYNGFDVEARPEAAQDPDLFTLVYNGTVYPTQPVEDLVAAVRRLADRHPELRIRLRFPGLEFDPVQAARVRSAASGRESLVEMTDRLPRDEVIRLQLEAHVLVMLAHRGVRGVASTKMFEYMGLDRPILVYPNDHDILEELVVDTEAGFVCDTPADLDRRLEALAQQFLCTGRTEVASRPDRVAVYSRLNQARRLADLLDSP
jgi:glycosyltransferase involved in cell wall biosynthesis